MADLLQRCLHLISPWTRLIDRHPWSHNDAYGCWIAHHARQLRTPHPRKALDIGCGTGNLLARLAGTVDQVTGIEPDPPTAATAAARFAGDPRVRVIHGTFADRPDDTWDLITLVAVLHHLPLEETLTAIKPLIKPGGELVVVGLSQETRRDLGWSAISLLLNPLIGLILHPRPDGTVPTGMTAPASNPTETFEQVSRAAHAILPGVRLRRGLFFRYTLIWRKLAR